MKLRGFGCRGSVEQATVKLPPRAPKARRECPMASSGSRAAQNSQRAEAEFEEVMKMVP